MVRAILLNLNINYSCSFLFLSLVFILGSGGHWVNISDKSELLKFFESFCVIVMCISLALKEGQFTSGLRKAIFSNQTVVVVLSIYGLITVYSTDFFLLQIKFLILTLLLVASLANCDPVHNLKTLALLSIIFFGLSLAVVAPSLVKQLQMQETTSFYGYYNQLPIGSQMAPRSTGFSRSAVVALAGIIFLYLIEQRWLIRLIYSLIGLVALTVVVLLESRGGYVMLVVLAGTWLIFYTRAFVTSIRKIAIGAALIGAGTVSAFSLKLNVIWSEGGRFGGVHDFFTTSGRTSHWLEMLHRISVENIFIGQGALSDKLHFGLPASNSLFYALYSGGVLAAGLVLFVYLRIFVDFATTLFNIKIRANSSNAIAIIYCLSLVMIYLARGLFENTWSQPGVDVFFFLGSLACFAALKKYI